MPQMAKDVFSVQTFTIMILELETLPIMALSVNLYPFYVANPF